MKHARQGARGGTTGASTGMEPATTATPQQSVKPVPPVQPEGLATPVQSATPDDDRDQIIAAISRKDIDFDRWAQDILTDAAIRETCVELLLTHPAIMVYYNAYQVLSIATRMRPELFTRWFDEFAALLTHHNSYHRDFGLTLTAHLAVVDTEGWFAECFPAFNACFGDPKFMTCQHYVRTLPIVAAAQPDLIASTVDQLLRMEEICPYTEKQKALLKSDILGFFSAVFFSRPAEEQTRILHFAARALTSISPKTRTTARTFLAAHGR